MEALNSNLEIIIDIVISFNNNNHANEIVSELKKVNDPGSDYNDSNDNDKSE